MCVFFSQNRDNLWRLSANLSASQLNRSMNVLIKSYLSDLRWIRNEHQIQKVKIQGLRIVFEMKTENLRVFQAIFNCFACKFLWHQLLKNISLPKFKIGSTDPPSINYNWIRDERPKLTSCANWQKMSLSIFWNSKFCYSIKFRLFVCGKFHATVNKKIESFKLHRELSV